MEVIIRNSNHNDVNGVYDLHKKCFSINDQWYKQAIQQFINNSFVVEIKNTKEIIGVLLQGSLIPCDPSEKDNFLPLTPDGIIYKCNDRHITPNNGITMLCVDPLYRKKGLARKLIELHLNNYKNEIVCLNTRKSNKAYHIYLNAGYEHIAVIKDKYYLPTEDSYFMIKKTN